MGLELSPAYQIGAYGRRVSDHLGAADCPQSQYAIFKHQRSQAEGAAMFHFQLQRKEKMMCKIIGDPQVDAALPHTYGLTRKRRGVCHISSSDWHSHTHLCHTCCLLTSASGWHCSLYIFQHAPDPAQYGWRLRPSEHGGASTFTPCTALLHAKRMFPMARRSQNLSWVKKDSREDMQTKLAHIDSPIFMRQANSMWPSRPVALTRLVALQ